MNNIKTYLNFRNGEIFETGKYDWDISEKETTIEKVKFFLAAFIFQNKLSGNVCIEIKNRKLYIDCNVKPKKYEKQLNRKLSARYQTRDRNLL
jgi:hypothetical protein